MIRRLAKRFLVEWVVRWDALARRGGSSRWIDPAQWGLTTSEVGGLIWEGVDLTGLAKSFDGPVHVVRRSRLRSACESFLRAFQSPALRVILASSYKTNPVPAVLKDLHGFGTFAEVISEFELWLALRLGVPPDRIVFNGPGKNRSSIDMAVSNGIKLINIDGLWEIPVIADSCRSASRSQQVGVRVVTSVGWSGQFGLRIDDGEARSAFEEIARFPELVPSAIHLHLGTGVDDVPTYQAAIDEALTFSADLEDRFGIKIRCIDVGGGFPVPTVRKRTHWDERLVSCGYAARLANLSSPDKLREIADAIVPRIERYGSRVGGEPLEVIFEPGRAITSGAQLLLLTVIAVKERASGRAHVILNGGKNITMPLGWETHMIYAANRVNSADLIRQDLFGPLCHPGDVIANNILMPRLRAGDVVAIMDSGAYFVPNEMNFSNPRTGVVVISDGEVQVVRTREIFSEIIARDVF